MTSRSLLIGLIALSAAFTPIAASARHDNAYGYGNEYQNSYYGQYPYSAPHGHAGYRGNTGQNGYRCYYWGKDGSCMNYSYRHGPSYSGWYGGGYSATYGGYRPYDSYDRYSDFYSNDWDDTYSNYRGDNRHNDCDGYICY